MGNSSSNVRARPEYNPVSVAQPDIEAPAHDVTRGQLTVEFLSTFIQDRNATQLVIFVESPADVTDKLVNFAANLPGDVIYAHPSESASYQLVKLPKNLSHIPLFKLWTEPRALFLRKQTTDLPLLIVNGFTDASFLSRVPTRKEFPKRFNDLYSQWNGKTICVVQGLPPTKLIKDSAERWIIVDE